MKKRFLLLSLLTTSFVNAQSLTQANEPTIGASSTMYICDSLFTNANDVSGAGVTWDFSLISGYPENPNKVLTVKEPDTTIFTGATKMTEIADFISTYWSSNVDQKNSKGFIFKEKSIGEIVINYSEDDEKLMSYPFSMVSTFTDPFSGTLSNSFLYLNNITCSGSITSSMDADGTLKLPNSTTYSNVLRHKIVESTVGTINIPGLGDILTKVNRTQYDYYAPEISLPVFSHITVKINATGINKTVSLVLSAVQPTSTASLTSINESKFRVYPNPTTDKIIIKGEFIANSSAKIVDQLGRVVRTVEVLNDGSEIDLSTIQAGIYILSVSQNGIETQERISVK